MKFKLKKASVSVGAALLSILLAACSTAAYSETTPVSPAMLTLSTAADNKTSKKLSAPYTTHSLDDGISPIVEGMGFNSPEDAAEAYLEGLRNTDLNCMISTFAVESYAENYNFEAAMNRMKVYVPSQEIKLPNSNEFITAMNIESRRSSVTNMILRQYLFLCDSEFDQSQPQIMEDDLVISEFVAQLNKNLNTNKFQTLEVLGFIPPEALTDMYSSEQNQKNIARLAEIYGADELVCRVAVFELDGSRYMLCLDAVDYGGKWYISQFGGNIGALMSVASFTMGIVPVPTELYNEIHTLIKQTE